MLTLNDPTGNLDGWRCKPVSHITGRLEQIDNAILVLAWPANHAAPIPARLVYVPAEWVVNGGGE